MGECDDVDLVINQQRGQKRQRARLPQQLDRFLESGGLERGLRRIAGRGGGWGGTRHARIGDARAE